MCETLFTDSPGRSPTYRGDGERVGVPLLRAAIGPDLVVDGHRQPHLPESAGELVAGLCLQDADDGGLERREPGRRLPGVCELGMEVPAAPPRERRPRPTQRAFDSPHDLAFDAEVVCGLCGVPLCAAPCRRAVC